MGEFSIRSAQARDAADLAILENMASRGLAQWFWQHAVNQGKAVDAFQWGRDKLLEGAGQFGWFNSIVAQRDDIILSSAMFYKATAEAAAEDYGDMSNVLKPLADLRRVAAGDWYLDSIAVYPSSQGQGAGTALFDNYLDQGRQLGLKMASLVVESSNITALKFYQSQGFGKRATRPYKPFGPKSDTQNWLLLSAALDQGT